jgi:hypothetical protein
MKFWSAWGRNVRRGKLYFLISSLTIGLSILTTHSTVSSQGLGNPSISATGPVLFVVGSTTLNRGDSAVLDFLQKIGFDVTVLPGNQAEPSHATGKKLVVISSTVSAAAVNTKFRKVEVPLLTWETDLFTSYELGIAAQKGVQSSAALRINRPGHKMAGGLNGDIAVGSSTQLAWAEPWPSAEVVATLGNNRLRAVVFGYQKGADMQTMVAPAKRVGIFLTDDSASSLNARGWRLFESAVAWAVDIPS